MKQQLQRAFLKHWTDVVSYFFLVFMLSYAIYILTSAVAAER